jgi:polyisoprenoid-binding protein YceI
MTAAPPAPGAVTPWKLDPAHSLAEFKIKHMMISHVKGRFDGLSGTLSLDETDHTRSSVEASIDVSTIKTGDEQRDGHLKSAEFFDAEKFPAITFKSSHIDRKGRADYDVTGDLTMHGVTKAVTFAVEDLSQPSKDPWGNQRIGLSATARINRKDFGLSWNSALEAGGLLVGEDATISLEVQFING